MAAARRGETEGDIDVPCTALEEPAREEAVPALATARRREATEEDAAAALGGRPPAPVAAQPGGGKGTAAAAQPAPCGGDIAIGCSTPAPLPSFLAVACSVPAPISNSRANAGPPSTAPGPSRVGARVEPCQCIEMSSRATLQVHRDEQISNGRFSRLGTFAQCPPPSQLCKDSEPC